MSMSDILTALLFLLVPLRHSKADRRMAKDTFALIQHMVVAKSSPFFNASSSAWQLWNLLHSSAIPPVLVKTNGVNVPCSTSKTRLLYCLFFSLSCSWNICFGDSSRYESAFGWHTRTSKNADCCLDLPSEITAQNFS